MRPALAGAEKNIRNVGQSVHIKDVLTGAEMQVYENLGSELL
jgi:hypothetical protein